MAFQETTLCVGIESNTLCAYLMPPHLVYMPTRLLTTQIFDWQSVWMICVWMCLPSSSAHKLAFEHGHKGDRDYLHTITLHFFGEFQCLLPLPTFHISSYYHTPRDSIMCRHLFQASWMLPHLAYMSTRELLALTLDSQLLSMMHVWIFLPLSRSRKLAQAFRTGTEGRLSGIVLSHCIFSKSSIAFS